MSMNMNTYSGAGGGGGQGGGGGGGNRGRRGGGGGNRNGYVGQELMLPVQQPMRAFRTEVAAELGLMNYDMMDKGELTSRQNGYVGGNMTKKMVGYAEQAIARDGASVVAATAPIAQIPARIRLLNQQSTAGLAPGISATQALMPQIQQAGGLNEMIRTQDNLQMMGMDGATGAMTGGMTNGMMGNTMGGMMTGGAGTNAIDGTGMVAGLTPPPGTIFQQQMAQNQQQAGMMGGMAQPGMMGGGMLAQQPLNMMGNMGNMGMMGNMNGMGAGFQQPMMGGMTQ